jgi:hypothetical protein
MEIKKGNLLGLRRRANFCTSGKETSKTTNKITMSKIKFN